MAKQFAQTQIPVAGSNRVALVRDFLATNYDIKINIFDRTRVTISCKTDRYSEDFPIELENISLHMEEEGIRGCDSILKKVMSSLHDMKPFNPIREYYQALEGNYSGTSHIDLLCSHLKARDYGDKEEGYYQKRLVYTFRKWIVAMVACAMGIKANDAMFIIVNNDEGIGKSSFFEFLIVETLKAYFSKSTKDMNYPDMFTTNVLILFDEMLGLTKSTSEEFKNTLSSQHINVSKRFTSTKQRYASACGTSNKDAEHGGFLLPEMGYRRFIINHVDHIDWQEYIKCIDPNQIFAEAVMLLSQNFEYTWNAADFAEFAEYNSRFIVQTSSFKLIKEFYRVPEAGEEELAQFKQPVEILRDLRTARKINSSMNTVSDVNIGIALKQLGYSRVGKKLNGGSRYGYNVIPLF